MKLKINAFRKNIALVMVTMLSGVVSAEGYTVPAIQNENPLLLFSEQKPLNAKERKALTKAKDWIDADQYPFRDGNTVTYLYEGGQSTIVCAPLKLCVLKLEDEEKVVPDGLHLGDSARWTVTPSVGAGDKTHVIIKPVDVGLDTSLVIVTNRRTYHIKLVSRSKDYMPVVTFHYPEQINAKWQAYYAQQAQGRDESTLPGTGENLGDLDFEYKISGCSNCRWRPLRVYNNNQQTIIQMSQDMNSSEAPALLVKNQQGEQMVNYRVHGDRYIVDQVFDEAILIAGVGRKQSRVTITRNEL